MNKMETDYASILAGRCACGELAGFWFEAVSLNLAPGLRCSYTPDFLVQRADGVLECHEVKGYWEDDARVKIKCAAEKFPFVFVAVTRPNKKTGWQYESFGHEEEPAPGRRRDGDCQDWMRLGGLFLAPPELHDKISERFPHG